MTVNIRINREAICLAVGLIVLLFSFVTLMWFPGAFFAVIWAVLVFLGSSVIAVLAMLAIYNLLGKISKDDEETEVKVEEEEVG